MNKSIGFLAHWGVCLLGSLLISVAQAQSQYPTQLVKLVVPFAAGGLPDTVARIVAQRLQHQLGQSVIVDNRPGANGLIAAQAILASEPDGYNVLVTDGSLFSITPKIVKNMPIDARREFIPVAQLARSPLFLAVHPKLQVSSFDEFVKYVRARPGEINYGSSGLGSVHQLSMEAIKSALGLDMKHVPFRGTGQSVPALLGGHVEALFSAYPSLTGGVHKGDIKIIAANSAVRSRLLPDVPAVGEFIQGYDFVPLVGFFVRVGTPNVVVQKLANEAMSVVRIPDIEQQFLNLGIEPAAEGPERLEQILKSEIHRVDAAVAAAKLQPM